MKTQAACLIVSLTVVSNVYAELIVTIPNITVTAGEESFVDVLVSSTGTDEFQGFFLDFTSTTSGLFRSSGNPASQFTATGPDYIFLGNSFQEDEQDFDPAYEFDFVTDDVGSSILTVEDETFDLSDREVTTSDSLLLARLHFVAPTSGSFDIDLDLGTSVFFSRAPANPLLEFESAVVDVTASRLSATITANASAAVPEPSSIALLCLIGVGVVFRHRHKQATAGAPTS